MKNYIKLTIMILLGSILFAGCSKKLQADTDTVYIEEDGTVQSVDTGLLNEEYYDVEELEQYIESAVSSVNESDEDAMKLVELKTSDNDVKLTLSYKSPEVYEEFNGLTLFSGTVAEAKESGYGFDPVFYSVSEGEKQQEIDSDEILSNNETKIIIIEADVNVKVDGEIIAISGKNTEISDKDLAVITTENEDMTSDLTYIIYQ